QIPALRDVAQEGSEQRSHDPPGHARARPAQEVPALADVGELVDHDLVEQVADTLAGLRLVVGHLVQQGIGVALKGDAEQLGHEGWRILHRIRDGRKQAVEALLEGTEGHPHDAIEMDRAKHLVEEPHVAELLSEMVPADLPRRRPGLGQAVAGLPGRRDPDPLVARHLVDAREEQGLAIDASRIVAKGDVIAIERLRIAQGAARTHGRGMKGPQDLALGRKVLLRLEQLSVPGAREAQVILEVLLALSWRAVGEDGSIQSLSPWRLGMSGSSTL